MKIKSIAIAALLLTACNDVDIDLFDSPAIDAGAGTLATTEATISSLSFTWQPVEGAYQYGYTLTNAEGAKVRQGVTRETSMTFVNLEIDSPYKLTIEAYGANGNPTLVMTTDASTLAKQQLATPDVDKMVVTVTDGAVTFTWPAVANADYYDYSLTNTATGREVSKGSADTNSFTLSKLAFGTYELTLTACSDNPGYPTSETAYYTYTRRLEAVGQYDCKYTSYALGAATRTIIKYEDGSYAVQAFYGVDGYDLKFTVGGGTIDVTEYVSADGVLKDVATGLSDYPTLTITVDKKNCIYSPNTADGKRVKMNCQLQGYASDGQDVFSWEE